MCKDALGVHGFNKKPHARRIVDLNNCFYLMSMRYQCKNRTCGVTINGHDRRIIENLPQHLQMEFPAILTHKSGVSKVVADLLRPCVQNSLGPTCFAKMLRELHMLEHDRRELQYLSTIKYRRTHPTVADMFEQQPRRQSVTYPSFSTFNDRQGYAGHVPSAQYFGYLYNAIIDELRPSMDKEMMILDGSVLKGDHSFKIIKHISNIEGTPTFNALWTVCNEYEEVRMQCLVPSKSLSHLQFSFEKMRDAYQLYGHKMPELFFTDNVKGNVFRTITTY